MFSLPLSPNYIPEAMPILFDYFFLPMKLLLLITLYTFTFPTNSEIKRSNKNTFLYNFARTIRVIVPVECKHKCGSK